MESTQIFGLRPVIEAIEAGKTFNKIFIQKGLSGTLFTQLSKLISTHQLPMPMSLWKSYIGLLGEIIREWWLYFPLWILSLWKSW